MSSFCDISVKAKSKNSAEKYHWSPSLKWNQIFRSWSKCTSPY